MPQWELPEVPERPSKVNVGVRKASIALSTKADEGTSMTCGVVWRTVEADETRIKNESSEERGDGQCPASTRSTVRPGQGGQLIYICLLAGQRGGKEGQIAQYKPQVPPRGQRNYVGGALDRNNKVGYQRHISCRGVR